MAHWHRLVRVVWSYLAEVLGETSYARYCQHVRAQGGKPATEQEFFRQQLERKYARISRCC